MKMHLKILVSAFLTLPFAIIAAPTNHLEKPPPCICKPGTTIFETMQRSDAFAKAFIFDKDITEAFKYISAGYINHNPAAKNGSDSAWDILSPIWAEQEITPLRTAFEDPQSWLNYKSKQFGEIVDRYRWEGGCIAEHWDQGEKFPDWGVE